MIINYTKFKYGPDKVSRIITFGTAAAKAAVKDVMRVLEKPIPEAQKMSDAIPKKPNITLDEAIATSQEFAEMYADPELKEIIDLAKKFEGMKKNRSMHACFDGETLINTKNGYKKIKDIQKGELVLTHKGNYKEVAEKQINLTDTEVIITPLGMNRVITTPEHPFLVAKFENNLFETNWVKAEDLNIGDYLVSSNNNYEEDKYIPISIIEYRDVINKAVYNLSVYDDNSYVANDLVVHNCGVLVAPNPITDYMPQCMLEDKDGNKEPTTQFVMTECEDMGLLKMDFLGLRTLGVIHNTLDNIKKTQGINLNPEDIDIFDLDIYGFMARGNNDAIFQVESPYMSGLIQRMYQDYDKKINELKKAGKLNDDSKKELAKVYFARLCDANALGRPGPMEEIPNYIHNMLNPQDVKYDVQAMENVLKATNGIIVFQEQSMILTRILAGFTPGQADKVRKGMGRLCPSI